MSREEEKEKIVEALMSLYAVTNKVSEVFCNVDEGFLNEIISSKDYPYELSFDEQSSKVLEWIMNSIERSKNL